MKDFAGKTATVTGAASGMGRAFAERFAREGMMWCCQLDERIEARATAIANRTNPIVSAPR